jgi:glycosyltransferase involved in cell wall biosynthesis
VVFIGRLGMEKGINVLIDAWKRWGEKAPMLEIIGDGPERNTLEKQVAEAGNIRFMGQVPYEETQKKLARASLLLLPSLCFEGFPMVIREAFALGVPVAASRLGSMPDIVTDEQDGALFSPGDADDLLEKVSSIWEKPEALAVMAKNARKTFEARYTAGRNYDTLMEIYRHAMERQAAR